MILSKLVKYLWKKTENSKIIKHLRLLMKKKRKKTTEDENKKKNLEK